jgi:hypothetical protein
MNASSKAVGPASTLSDRAFSEGYAARPAAVASFTSFNRPVVTS